MKTIDKESLNTAALAYRESEVVNGSGAYHDNVEAAILAYDEAAYLLWHGFCVGGPLDGQYKAAPHGAHLQVVNPLPNLDFSQSGPESDVADAPSTTVYCQQEFHTPQRTFRFWVPEGTTPGEVMERLIGSYKPKSAA